MSGSRAPPPSPPPGPTREALRLERRRRLATWGGGLALVLGLLLVWGLRSLLVPTLIGALLAYLSAPALRRLILWGLPRPVAVVVLFGGVLSLLALLVAQVRTTLPDDAGRLELKVRSRHALGVRYEQLTGRDDGGPGNLIATWLGPELDPVVGRLEDLLRLSPDEEVRLRAAHGEAPERFSPHLLAYLEDNATHSMPVTAPSEAVAPAPASTTATSLVVGVIEVLSLWLVMPFVFLFLLLDDGRILRSVIAAMPNAYFELALTTVDRVNDAIGRYLRGTLAECALVGLTFVIGLSLIGVDFGWALTIGAVAGLTNAIPFLGPGIGLVVGLTYALVAEEATPLLPFLGPEHLPFGVLVTVGVAQLLDNLVFQPVVLGSAVNLHPLAVVLGVMGGSILLGVAGMLFAVPAMVVTKVVVGTSLRELRAYRLI